MSGPKAVRIEVDIAKVRALAEAFVDQMNECQAKDMTADEVIAASLFAAGASMACRGVHMTGDETIKDCLVPFWRGYVAARKEHLDLMAQGPQ